MTDEYSDDEITQEEWKLFVARGFAEELANPSEDIYTLEDGVPINEDERQTPT